jgi:hypothetical protein
MTWVEIALLVVGVVLFVVGKVIKRHADPSNDRYKYFVGGGWGLIASGLVGLIPW